MNACKICDLPTKNNCSNCNQVSYCGPEHQKQDWKAHKPNCRPFKIAHSEELGRFLVATRAIKANEIILKEAPLIRGPSQITGPVCLGCLNGIEPTDYISCEKCGWLLCGPECKALSEHAAECQLTQDRGKKVNIQEFTSPHPLYQCVSTVRCLLLNETNPTNALKFNELESLENQRRGSAQWKADLASIGKFIPKFFQTDKYEEDVIMRTVGALQINGHEVPTSDPPHVAIFYTASFLENSCVPNLAKSFTKTGQIVLWAPKAIKKNEHLSICYSDSVWGTADRQRHLMQTKLFKCSCQRCSDPTELDTNYSAIKCEDKNCTGLMLPTNVNDWSDSWCCKACQKQVQKQYIENILQRAGNDIQHMEKTVENGLKFLAHYAKWLPPQHYHMSEVKILLVQKISSDIKQLMILADDKLELKLKYAKELVELYEILAPCEIRLLGTLCFELHSAIAERTRRIALQTTISPKEMLMEALLYVDKCVNYLQYESDIFVEGHILRQARINRDALRMVLDM